MSSPDNLLRSVWTQTKTDTDSVPERIFKKVNFEKKKSSDDNKMFENYQASKVITHAKFSRGTSNIVLV